MGKCNANKLDSFNIRILKEITKDASQSNDILGKKVGLFSPASISKRKKLLSNIGIINGVKATLDPDKMGLKYPVMIFVRAKFGSNYVKVLGEKLTKLPGILMIYNISGDIDFVMIGIYKDRNEYLSILDLLTAMPEIERTDTRQVHRIIKDFDYSGLLDSFSYK